MASEDFQGFIDEVLSRNDIVEVISAYTKVKRVGSRYQALCPLHNDKKSPSLSISPDKQLFHCFGCGAGGNVINFIEAMEHLEFMDALTYLADRIKLPMPEFRRGESREQRDKRADKRRLIYEINAAAGRFFHDNLLSPTGRGALKYLQEREITSKTINRFGLGYAPEGWTTLISHLKTLGFKEHDMYEAGVAKRRETDGSYFDAFYDGRIMFPIIDVRGNVIGFGGRLMQERDNTGKYINTPETVVFHKKENLFGLNFAKNHCSERILLMEGYMDVISLHQAGICNAAASLGTAFTPEQASLVKRYAQKAVLCYDADEAGKKATLRAGEILTAAGIKTSVLELSFGKDPDEFIKSKGADMFEVLVSQAKPLIQYRIDELEKKYNFEDDEGKVDFSDEASKIIAQIADPIERELYISKIANLIKVSSEAFTIKVKSEMRRLDAASEHRSEVEQRRMEQKRRGSETSNRGLLRAEQQLLALMCEKEVRAIVEERGLSPSDFQTALHKDLAEYMLGADKAHDILPQDVIIAFDEAERGKISEIMMADRGVINRRAGAIQCIEKILESKFIRLMNTAAERGDVEAVKEYQEELAKLKQNSGRNY